MSIASTQLKMAVHQHPITSIQGIQQRFFSQWFSGFVYNQIWEDPVVDLEALALEPTSQVLTISSAGCNVLNYLLKKPARIVAIDLNPYHLALTRLKLRAAQYLPHHDLFYAWFGYGHHANVMQDYQDYIQPHLTPEEDAIWYQARFGMGAPRLTYFRQGLYQQTRFGYFMRFLHDLARQAGFSPQLLLQAQSLEEQKAIFNQQMAPFFEQGIVKTLGQLPFSVFSLGIPPQQYRAMKAQGNLIAQYRQRVQRLACQFPIADNYFAWQAFSLSYDHQFKKAVPDYLKAENFLTIRQHAHQVETHLTSLIDYLAVQPERSFDRFVFLDAQDWMSSSVLNQLWQQILRVGRPGSRIIFRTAAADSPLEAALNPALMAQFEYHAETSARLFQRDRSAIYGGFHLYTLR